MSPPVLLWIGPDLPLPPIRGSRIDMAGRLDLFRAAGYRLVLAVCPAPAMAGSRDQNALPDLGAEIHIVHRAARWSARESPAAVAAVQRLVDRHRPTLVWCEYSDLFPLAASLERGAAPLWLRSLNFELGHALEKEIQKRPWRAWRGRSAPRSAWRWSVDFGRRLAAIHRIERASYRGADRVLHISPADARAMARLYGGGARAEWLPPFVEADPVAARPKDRLDVLYAGSSLSNNVNLEGARMVLDRIAPAAEAAYPGRFVFHIVGRGGDLLGGGAGNVRVHGWVDDLDRFMADMDIACVPIRYGWGCKIKVLHALAAGIPTIGAAAAFRGVPPLPRGYAVCRGTRDYVAALGELRSLQARRRMGETARTAYLDWRGSGRRALCRELEELASRSGAPEPSLQGADLDHRQGGGNPHP